MGMSIGWLAVWNFMHHSQRTEVSRLSKAGEAEGSAGEQREGGTGSHASTVRVFRFGTAGTAMCLLLLAASYGCQSFHACKK